MRTKEKDWITHLYKYRDHFRTATKNIAEAFPYYNKLINELYGKSIKLYDLYLNEHRTTKDTTRVKNYGKKNTIEKVLKLKRGVILHAIETGNKSLKCAANYTYSDFYRPSENIRIARFQQIVNAARRIKHPEHFGLSTTTIRETEELVKKYCIIGDSPANRKKERAGQAKQCRKLLGEINFILRDKMTPFLENIKEEYPEALHTLKAFLNPVKIGRPSEKSKRKKVSQAAKEKPNPSSQHHNSTTLVCESGILTDQKV